ncbi:MAG: hypothetical protein ABT940_09525 [Alphaproteobacteria bacterium]
MLPHPVAIVCPADISITETRLEQQFESMRVQVETERKVVYFVTEDMLSRCERWLSTRTWYLLESDSLLNSPEVIFLYSVPTTIDLIVRERARFSVTDWTGRIRPLARPIDTEDYDLPLRHIFAKLSPMVATELLYFPYGYSFRFPGLGPIDALGFRNTADLRALADRPANHKVIACFGGSGCWGSFSLHHQTIPSIIECVLNEYCSSNNIDIKFSVINFSQSSNVTLNHIFNYVLYGQPLRPEIVISHGGFNDFVSGLINDPYLLMEHSITYPVQLEAWAQKLHDTSHIPCKHDEEVYGVINQPLTVIRAYVSRMRQFAEVVRGVSSRFVWGLQPFKDLPSAGPQWSESYRMIGGLYKMFVENFRPDDGYMFADCHTMLENHGDTAALFGDNVHLTPAGDRVVGEFYAGKIIEAVFVERKWKL